LAKLKRWTHSKIQMELLFEMMLLPQQMYLT
jgi:hypothetical protein